MDDKNDLPQRPVPNQVFHPGEKPAQPSKDVTVQVPHDAQNDVKEPAVQPAEGEQLSHVLLEQLEDEQDQPDPTQGEVNPATTDEKSPSQPMQEQLQKQESVAAVSAELEDVAGQQESTQPQQAQQSQAQQAPQQPAPLPHIEGAGRPMRMGMRRRKAGKGAYAFIIIFFLLAGAGAGYYVYQTSEKQASELNKENAQLTTQLADLDAQTKQQEDANKGVAAASKTADEMSSGKLSLADGKVTFAAPKDWMKMPAESCPSGAKDADALCQDVAAIMPSSLDDKTGVAKWKATVSVFDYDGKDGTAQQWFEKKFFKSTLASNVSPKAINIKTDPIDGNSALRFQMLDGTLAKPNSFTSYYVVVKGSRAVVVQAIMQSKADKYDYRNDYGPALDQLIASVKFSD